MHPSENETRDGIRWPRLVCGVLLKRYRRFLADIRLANGEVVTAHCPNTGSMRACSEPGRPVYLSCHDNPRRKHKYGWELIEMPTSLVGVNTLIPNRLVAFSIANGFVDLLSGYTDLRREVPAGDHSRIDLMLTAKGRRPCYVEVKNCTLVEGGRAAFPDAVTARGLKHLRQLQTLVAEGNRCVMFYFIQRMDAVEFRPADHIDPAYGDALRQAAANGVEIAVYDTAIDLEQVRLRGKVPFRF